MNIKTLFNRSVIAIDAYLRCKRKHRLTENRNVLIIFQQAFGDSVVLQDSLIRYAALYPRSKGYHLKLIAQPSVLSFMKENLSLPAEIEYEAMDFKRFLADYPYYRKVVKQYDAYAGTAIVPGTSLSAEILSAALNAKRKVGLVRCFDVKSPFVMATFAQIAYTERVKPDKSEMMLQRHRRLLHYLGDTTYKASLPKLLPKDRMIEGKYAVMCPGASKSEKCWPIERFAEAADYLIEQYKLPVHLCGGAEAKRSAEQMKSLVKHPDHVIDHTGKTSFSDWSAIIQHADLVLGNDSATLHIAVAGRAKSICITGVYDKYQFFPYQADHLEGNDILPVTLMRDMPCEWCRTKGYDAGYGNPSCTARIKAGKCAECIEAVTVEEVKTAIDKLLREFSK